MNERIQALADEAEDYADGIVDQGGEFHPAYTRKLAELIVRECGQVLVDNTPVVNLVEDWDKGYDLAMNDCIHHIYEHFGVE